MIMKNIWLIICIILFFAPLPVCAADRNVIGNAGRPINTSSLSVFNFNATTLDASRYGPEVTNMLSDALSKNQAFSIISRRDLEDFLRLNDLQQNDNLDNLVNIGSRLGLNFIVAGRIEKKGVILSLECFVVNIHDKKVVFTRKVQAMGDSSLASEVSKMSDSIAAAIAPNRAPGDPFTPIDTPKQIATNVRAQGGDGRDTSNVRDARNTFGNFETDSQNGWQWGYRTYQGDYYIKASIDKTAYVTNKNGSLRVDYKIGKVSIGAWNDKKRDWSSYNGIEFYTKSNHKEIRFAIYNASRNDSSNSSKTTGWRYSFNATTDWKKVRIGFKELGYIPDPKSKGDGLLNLDLVEKFQFYVSTDSTKPGDSGTFWIDGLKLF
jgi:TolB-like protein